MPVALQTARRTGTSPSSLLMPMSFMSLLGGLVTLVGTSTNIIVSQLREETLGKPFQMFDFAPVGLSLTAIGFVFVSFGWRLLPHDRHGQSGMDEAVAGAPYSTEATVPQDWPEALATVADLRLDEAGVRLTALITAREQRGPLPEARIRPATCWCWKASPRASTAFSPACRCSRPARDARSRRTRRARRCARWRP